jgi:cAMP phosphodiesterase
VDIAYVTTKYGDTEEVNRRKGKFQKLFKQAREKAEASKDAQGYHLQDGITTYQLFDSHLYTIISDLLSSEYDQQRKEQK